MGKIVNARFWAWLTAIAVLFAAFAPTLSHAQRAARGLDLDYASICTTSGLRWIDLKTNQILDIAPASEQGSHGERCHGCLPLMPGLIPTASLSTAAPVDMDGISVPFLFLHAPRTLFVWTQSQPRAPPAA